MSKGTVATIGLLAIISTFIIFFFASILVLLNISPQGESHSEFAETFWMSLMRALDPGTMGDDRGWSFRIIMFLITAYGIVMLSTFIGLISNGILSKIVDLRKGRSKVLESNHTLILGWSSKIHTIISELVIANENQKNPLIVVLAERDKVEMEDAVLKEVPKTKNTKLIFRSGNPIDINDLEIANPNNAKSIIILGKKSRNSDAEIIKVLLALSKNLQNVEADYHIIAEIDSRKNMEVAKMIGGNDVELILSDEFVARIMVQTSRQAGLSIVYTDLLDFQGDEIYFTKIPELVGKPFKEALFSFAKSSVIGLQTADSNVVLNPASDTIIERGTKLITISEDDDMVIFTGTNYDIQEELIVNNKVAGPSHDKILILGWNRRAKIIIRELASYAQSSSTITIVAELKNMEKGIDKLKEQCPNTKIEYIRANSADKLVLEELEMSEYDHMIILSYQDDYEIQQADAKTLITLLHLRDIAERRKMELNVVSEMLDAKNRELAKVTKADDFIVSDNMISLIISQVAENKYLMSVFEQLFKSEGNEIYLKPAGNYVKLGKEMNFYTVLEAAERYDELAIGYRKMENFQEDKDNFGVVLNPDKSKLTTFGEEDFIIVLSQK
jgi:Trk K+ transport system NAD-binding subunit